MILKSICLASLLFVLLSSQAQVCPDTTIRTYMVGNGTEFFLFDANFFFAKDSVRIEYAPDRKENIAFKILNKKCKWNQDFKEGESMYDLIAAASQKKAIIKILFTPVQKIIELKYGDSEEPRIFKVL